MKMKRTFINISTSSKIVHILVIVIAALTLIMLFPSVGANLLTNGNHPSNQSNDQLNSINPTEEIAKKPWPIELFPNIPELGLSSYSYTKGTVYEFSLTNDEALKFEEYRIKLKDAGATLLMSNSDISVWMIDTVEIQLMKGSNDSSLILSNEPAIKFEGEQAKAFEGFYLPENGRLVMLYPAENNEYMQLTYRCASTADVRKYMDMLKHEGWVSITNMVPVEGSISTAYKKGNRIIEIDYFSNVAGYLIKLRFDKLI